MGKRKINIEEEKNLAIEVRKHVCLYDKSSADYKNKWVKLTAWDKVDEVLGFEEGQGEIRFENLKKRYSKRKFTVKKCKSLGLGRTKELEKAKEDLKKYSFLRWLDPFVAGSETLSNIDHDRDLPPSEPHKTDRQSGSEEEYIADSIKSEEEEDTSSEYVSKLPSDTPKWKKRKESSDDIPATRNKRLQEKTNQESFKEDSDQIFGRWVASELASLSKKNKTKMKHEISNTIFKYQSIEDENLPLNQPLLSQRHNDRETPKQLFSYADMMSPSSSTSSYSA